MPTRVVTKNAGDTVGDLLRHAAHRGEGVPPLLALTVVVQLLKILRDRHQRGLPAGPLALDRLVFADRCVLTLWKDPSRDPRLQATEFDATEFDATEFDATEFDAAGDVYRVGTLALALFTGRLKFQKPGRWRPWGRLAPFRPLLEGMMDTRMDARWPVERALREARRLAMEYFAAWDDQRHAERRDREAELRHGLIEAVYLGRERDAAWRHQQLGFFLGNRAESDGDWQVARNWLREQAGLMEQRRAESKRSQLKILFTALPLVLATLLTTLLVVVLATAA